MELLINLYHYIIDKELSISIWRSVIFILFLSFLNIYPSCDGIPQDGCPMGFKCNSTSYITKRTIPPETRCEGACLPCS
jgi:hypothetical protein